MKHTTLSFLLFIAINVFSQGRELKLWPDKVPHNLDVQIEESTKTNEDGVVTHRFDVMEPTLTIYQPENWESTPSKCVIICPGGGYVYLSISKEGHDVAKYLADNGITGIVLKYRLPKDKLQSDKTVAPLEDAQQAIRKIRSMAKEFNLIEDQIGIMGFSAGGSLAAITSTRRYEATENGLLLPDFSILIYPVASMKPEITHRGSHDNLLGKEDLKTKEVKYSGELQINEHTPPAFIVHSFDDHTVPIENSIRYMKRLKEFNTSCEVHFYKKGGHGFGMLKGYTDTWPSLMIRWIDDL